MGAAACQGPGQQLRENLLSQHYVTSVEKANTPVRLAALPPTPSPQRPSVHHASWDVGSPAPGVRREAVATGRKGRSETECGCNQARKPPPLSLPQSGPASLCRLNSTVPHCPSHADARPRGVQVTVQVTILGHCPQLQSPTAVPDRSPRPQCQATIPGHHPVTIPGHRPRPQSQATGTTPQARSGAGRAG